MKKIAICLFIVSSLILLPTACTNPDTPPVNPETASPLPDPNLFDYTAKTYDISSFDGKYKVQGRCPIVSYQPPNAKEEIEALALDYSCAAFSSTPIAKAT